MTGIVRRIDSFRVSFLAAGLVLAPALAQACAVCTAGRDEENAAAFLMTTIFMSLMPLVAIGTLIFVLWRRLQKLEAEREQRAAAAPPATAAAAVRSESR